MIGIANQHGLSGLSTRVLESTIDAAAAERETLRFLDAWLGTGTIADVRQQRVPGRRFLARTSRRSRGFFTLSQSRREHTSRNWRCAGPRRSPRGSARHPVTSTWMTCASRSASCNIIASACCVSSDSASLGPLAVTRSSRLAPSRRMDDDARRIPPPASRPPGTSRFRPPYPDSGTGCRCLARTSHRASSG